MTDTTQAKPAAKPARKRAAAKGRSKPKAPDPAQLRRLLAEAEGYGQTQSWQPLIDRWSAEEGLVLQRHTSGNGVVTARLAGIAASSTAGPQNALVNWTNAARRWLRQIGESGA